MVENGRGLVLVSVIVCLFSTLRLSVLNLCHSFVETFHTALFWCYVYYLSVTHYGHPEKLTHLCWHICSAIVPQAVTAATVQVCSVAFMYHRVLIRII
jgi:hypothetical protein